MSELSDKLASSTIKLHTKHLALHTRNADGSPVGWPCDEWSVTVEYEGRRFSTTYKAGLGHRKLDRSLEHSGNRYYTNQGGGRYFRDLSDVCESSTHLTRLVTPTLADVLSCLLSDARSAEDTFESWCADLGYDTDSRKAFDTYQACMKTRSAMLAVLGTSLFNELSALEH